MTPYVAVLRLADHRAVAKPLAGICASLSRLPGIDSVQPDWSLGTSGPGAGRAADSLVVVFDRAKVSLGEIVRAIEDQGVPVRGVAQSRARSADPAHLATA